MSRRLLPLLLCGILSLSLISAHEFPADGKVLELTDSNFDSAIAQFDYIFVDFYAPWCGHCKRLSPELDMAAQMLAGLDERIVIAKVDADKYTKLATKYKIDGFPSLKIFIHGVPVDYTSSRKADQLVKYLRKFASPNVSLLESDSAVQSFVETAGDELPIFIGFGLNGSMISELAAKYKKSAWFAVAEGFSEEVMIAYDFDKVPALVALHSKYNEKNVFYGPFEGEYLGDFVQQNHLPLAVPINSETLRAMSNDERKIVLTFIEDQTDEKSKKLVRMLRAAATANRDLIFGFVGVKQWEEFADTFDVNKKSELPKMIIWDRAEEYNLVVGSESLDEEGDHGSQISQFLQGYREGRTVTIRISSPSFMGFVNSLIGIRTVYLIVFIVALIMLIQSFAKQGDATPEIKHQGAEADDTNRSIPESDSRREEYQPGDKED